MNILILKELEDLIPALSNDEYGQLYENIVQEGVIREALCVFLDLQGNTILLDGHNRYKIAQETGIYFETKLLENIITLEQAKTWMLTNQLGKRNLTQVQKMEIAMKHKPILEKAGKERQRQAGLGTTIEAPHDTFVELGKIAGVGKETMRKFSVVAEKAEEDVREKMLASDISVHEAYKETRRREGSMRRLTVKRDAVDLEQRTNNLPAYDHISHQLSHGVEVGQWWHLGNHFLYVGDSSLPDFYESEFCKMKGGVDFAFADPPYGIDIDDWDSEFVWNHDYLSDLAKAVAVTPGHWAMHKFHKATNMPYKWQIAYWVKNGMSRGPVGLANYNTVVLFSKNSIHKQEQDFWQIEVIETTVKPTKDAYETPFKGRKPTEVMARLLDMYVPRNGTVIDPFGGSGTTLFVAERQGKTCIMAEILPAHAEQIIYRFEALTNWKAKLIK